MSELPGWISVSGQLEPLMTVAGCLARGEEITAVCKTSQCFRRVRLDLRELDRIGLGNSDIRSLQACWRCRSGQGCELTWASGRYPEGVPLQCYAGQGVTIVVSCKTCGAAKRYEVLHLIETLRRRGAGDGNTSVLKIDKAIRGNCRACGRRHWGATLVRPSVKGQGGFHADPMPKRA
jgi:hypothetical protein